jgi:hypothetical protein
MVQIGYNITVKSSSGMLLLLITSAVTWIIFTYYTSNLTARMTARDVSKENYNVYNFVAIQLI